MRVEQLYTNCLSEAAYYIESDGEAAVVDPLRDYQHYIEKAGKDGVKIKYIFETHFHADFVSGHIDLAKKTHAPIIYGPETETSYPVTIARDGERFKLGSLEIEVLHTPGHTPESTCYLLYDENKQPYCIFTGDTLFVGDVGRPDLFGAKISKEEMASRMFDSLKRLKQLPDEVIVYPAHGPGSSCGKNLGKETWSTIGVQKKLNYALRDDSREKFIHDITDGLSKPPQYFALNAAINKKGYDSLDEVLSRSLRALTIDEFEDEINNGTLVLDTRHQNEFEKGFIPTSIFIGLGGRFAEWVGTILDMKQKILLVTDPGKEEESVIRMARVGYENVIGYLKDGFHAWKNAGKPVDMLVSISADELALDYKYDHITLVDVRKATEFERGHVEQAQNIVLQDFNEELPRFENLNEPIYLHCQSGFRSMIAASLLKRDGHNNLKNVHGGFEAIQKTDLPIVTSSVAHV